MRKGLTFNVMGRHTRAHESWGDTEVFQVWDEQRLTGNNTLRGSGGRLRTERGMLGAGEREEGPEAWKRVGAQRGGQGVMWQRFCQEARVTSWLLRQLKPLKLILPCEFS